MGLGSEVKQTKSELRKGYGMEIGDFCVGCGQPFDGRHLDKALRPKPPPPAECEARP